MPLSKIILLPNTKYASTATWYHGTAILVVEHTPYKI